MDALLRWLITLLARRYGVSLGFIPDMRLAFECVGRDGAVKWADEATISAVRPGDGWRLFGAFLALGLIVWTLVFAPLALMGAAAVGLVVTEGLNDLLTKYFKGSSYTATWYVGLIDGNNFGTIAADDDATGISTDAGDSSSAGENAWQEFTAYTESNRVTLTLGTASAGSIDNSASKASFAINSDGSSIKGAFVVSTNTKAGTTGVLYGAGTFSSARSMDNGDTLQVTATLTAAAA